MFNPAAAARLSSEGDRIGEQRPCAIALNQGQDKIGLLAWVHGNAWRENTESRKEVLRCRFTLVGSLFGVERAICDMLATTREGCVLETGYTSLTSVLQAKLGFRVVCST